MVDPPDYKITFCLYYIACKATVECRNRAKDSNPEGLCYECGSQCNFSTKQKEKYFLIMYLKYQTERLFQHADVTIALLSFNRRETYEKCY